MDLIKDMKPRNIGPGGMSGRDTAIDVITSNPDIMYIGTASGGLWKTAGGGFKWDPIFEKEATGSIGTAAIQQSKKINTKIDSLVAIYLGKEDDRQGITSYPEPTVMDRIGRARSYGSSIPNGMTATEERLLQQAKDALQQALLNTNDFFNQDWQVYRNEVEKLTLSPFKETKSFSIDQ